MTGDTASGTSSGRAGTDGARHRLAIALAAGFAAVLIAVMIGDAESMMSDFAAAGVQAVPAHIWIWEATSIAAWLSVTPAIWWAVSRVRPPRFGWPAVAAIALAGAAIASGWHIAVMIVLRQFVYALRGEHYQFAGTIANPYLYEFRKDVATYIQFVGLAVLCQWLLARVGQAQAVAPADPVRRMIAVPDGAITHRVPIDEIDHVCAAGNYVELAWHERTLLHRATLAAIETELGDRFVRIHRSRLVRRDAIRAVETNQAGDFEVALASGTRLKGSRRFRDEVRQP